MFSCSELCCSNVNMYSVSLNAIYIVKINSCFKYSFHLSVLLFVKCEISEAIHFNNCELLMYTSNLNKYALNTCYTA